MKIRCVLLSVVLAMTFFARPLWADEVGDLLGQLGADAFDVREKAESALQSKGEAILAALKDTIATTTDAEVRMRCKRLQDAIQFSVKLAAIQKEYGNDPLKLEVAAKMMQKDRRMDEARALYRAAALACREIASGKTKHSMGPEMAQRKADELDSKTLADGAPVAARRGNIRVVRGGGGNAQIFINNIQLNGEDDVEALMIDALNNQFIIGE